LEEKEVLNQLEKATQDSPKPPASSDEDSGQDLKDYQEIPSVSCTDVEVITSSKDENEELQSLDEDKFKSQLEDEVDDEIEKIKTNKDEEQTLSDCEDVIKVPSTRSSLTKEVLDDVLKDLDDLQDVEDDLSSVASSNDFPPPPDSIFEDLQTTSQDSKVEDIGKDFSEKLKVEEVDSEVEKKIEKTQEKEDKWKKSLDTKLLINLQAAASLKPKTSLSKPSSTSSVVNDGMSPEEETEAMIKDLHEKIEKMKRKNSKKTAEEASKKKLNQQESFKLLKGDGSLNDLRNNSPKIFKFIPQSKQQIEHENFSAAPIGGVELLNNGEIKRQHLTNSNKEEENIKSKISKTQRSSLPSYYKKFLGANAFKQVISDDKKLEN